MEESQAGQDGNQHVPHLVGSKGALGKNLRESLISVFHHDEDKLEISQPAAARLENSNQVGMGQGGSCGPVRELCLQGRNSRDQLERGIGEVSCLKFCKENSAVIRATQKAAQRKHSVDKVAFPLRPDLAHR